MTAMDYLPSDLEHMNTNFLDMIENEANSQLLDIDNLNSDKLNDFLNGDLLHETQMEVLHESGLEYENEGVNNSNWLQSLQWNDMSKVPQSLIDASNEVENNNPNLLVNPQSVLPMHSTHQVIQNNNPTQQMNQLNSRNGIPVKINGQDAVLTPTQHPQIQYVTVQNVTTLSNTHLQGYTVQPITICPQQIQHVGTVTSPSLSSPVLVEHLQNGTQTTTHIKNNNGKVRSQAQSQEKVYPKPVYSYSCLIAMALKNSRTGNLPVSEIYNFMIDNFPYFKTAPDGWKNSVRHNLSLNKCFAKVDNGKPTGAHTRKGCLWGLNPAKVEKMEDEIVKWRKKDPESVKLSMSKPENLELIEAGKAGPPKEEPTTPIKQEPMTPVKSQGHLQNSQGHLQNSQGQSHGHIQKVGGNQAVHRVVCSQDSAVIVKTEPGDNNTLSVTEVNPYDPSLPNLAIQNGIWEDELSIGVVNNNHQTSTTASPLVSPTYNTNGKSQFHGNLTYSCISPNGTRSPISNVTPTKIYAQTPPKLYPQTPSKLVLA